MRSASSIPAKGLLGLLPFLALACGKSGESSTAPNGSDFAPTGNTTLSGVVTYKTVTIPAGVTVTVTADLTLTVSGDMKLSGTLKGDCVAITVKATGQFTNTGGTLDNSCTNEPDAGGPGVLVIGAAGITATGGELVTSGDFKMTNDISQTLSSSTDVIGDEALLRYQFLAQGTGGVPCNYTNYTTRSIPVSRSKGANGTPKGVDGGNGHYKDLGPCVGGINISGLTMSGQKGGDGGDGTVTGSTQAVGGKGGNMGAMLITAPSGNIVFSGTSTITTPDGGAGGNATGTGIPSGGSASALGGAGGDEAPTGFGGSPILIQATTGSIIVNGQLNIAVGKAGDGGNATATGAKGNDGSPGQPGGPATATGGAGGKTLDKQFTAVGNVGGNGTITVTGGNAGKGGNGTANGGVGGNGDPGQPGGKGGSMTAQGGNGGTAQLKGFSGNLIGNGGAAGNALYTLGNGGTGGSNCPNAGGAGGGGGDAIGGAGTPGTGLAAGAAGTAQANNAGNGNKGGDGNPPGGGGAKGNNTPPANPAPGSFQPGAPGGPCPGGVSLTVTPATQNINQGGQGSVHIVIGRTGGFGGIVTVTIKDDQGNVLTSQTIPASSTQADVSFTIPGTFGTGNHTFTVTASADGVPSVTQNFAVAVAQNTSTTLTVTFGEQATNPVTKVVEQIGSAPSVVIPVGSDGSATITVPATSTPVTFVVQQEFGPNRNTNMFFMTSDDLRLAGALAFNLPARSQLTATITGAPANSTGNAFVGTSLASFSVVNSSPFTVPLNRAETGIQVLGGCTLQNSNQDPISGVVALATYATAGGYVCNLGGAGVKNYVCTQTTVTGATAGTQLFIFGGFAYNDIQSTIWSKGFTAPSATVCGLNGTDLPAGALQTQTVQHIGSNAYEQKSYYYTQQIAWLPTLPPPLTTPTVNVDNSFSLYYKFNIKLSLQIEYQGGWGAGYSQPNTFGGNNNVSALWTPGYFGGTLPSTLTLNTFGDAALDPTYLPKSPGSVTGNVYAYSYSFLSPPLAGSMRMLAGVLNISF